MSDNSKLVGFILRAEQMAQEWADNKADEEDFDDLIGEAVDEGFLTPSEASTLVRIVMRHAKEDEND